MYLSRIFNFKAYRIGDFKFSIFITAILLNLIGLRLIWILQDPADNLYGKQLMGIIIGAFSALVISFIDYHVVAKLYIPLYLINLAVLFVVRFTSLGHAHYDAKRWIEIHGIGQVQPSEFSKLIIIIFIAAMLDYYKKYIDRLWFLVLLCLLSLAPVVLILVEPDLSTAIVVGLTFVFMVYASGISYKIVLPVIIVTIPLVIVLWWYYVLQPGDKLFIEAYQIERIQAFLHPDDPQYADLIWQQKNAGIAIARGGLTGKLLDSSLSKDSLYCSILPAIESDFIFTAVAETFGFIGSLVTLLLIFFIVVKGIIIAKKAYDFLGMLIALGISLIIGLQTIVNVCVSTELMPNTGIPFPFLSSGLSSLIGNMFMIGVLLNVGLQAGRPKEGKRESFVI